MNVRLLTVRLLAWRSEVVVSILGRVEVLVRILVTIPLVLGRVLHASVAIACLRLRLCICLVKMIIVLVLE